MAAKCDVIGENFRPGTLEKWGLGYEDLKRLNPGAVLVRISAYGQDGPLRAQPGFARITHAFSGFAFLAGEPGRVPVVPGSTSLADYLSGMYGAIGALMALRMSSPACSSSSTPRGSTQFNSKRPFGVRKYRLRSSHRATASVFVPPRKLSMTPVLPA